MSRRRTPPLPPRLQKIVNAGLEELKKEIAAIERRQQRLRAAMQGKATVKKIWVEGYVRPRRRIDGHHRTIITFKKEK